MIDFLEDLPRHGHPQCWWSLRSTTLLTCRLYGKSRECMKSLDVTSGIYIIYVGITLQALHPVRFNFMLKWMCVRCVLGSQKKDPCHSYMSSSIQFFTILNWKHHLDAQRWQHVIMQVLLSWTLILSHGLGFYFCDFMLKVFPRVSCFNFHLLCLSVFLPFQVYNCVSFDLIHSLCVCLGRHEELIRFVPMSWTSGF